MPAKKTTTPKLRKEMSKEDLIDALRAENVAVIELEDTLIECRLRVELENGKAVLNVKTFDLGATLTVNDPVAKIVSDLKQI